MISRRTCLRNAAAALLGFGIADVERWGALKLAPVRNIVPPTGVSGSRVGAGRRTALPRGLAAPASLDSSIDLWRIPGDLFLGPAQSSSRDRSRVISLAADERAASFLSPVRVVGAPFDEVVISWTGTAAAGSTARFLLRARIQDTWTDWYTMAVWRDGQTTSVRGQRDAAGRVDVDTLKLSSMADALQVQVDLEATGDSPAIRSVTAVAADTTVAPFGPGLVEGSAWGIDLPVPTRSQLLQDPSVAREICSPTSLTMVLNYWGVGLPVMDVVRAVRDGTTRIFGNWPANTAFASSLGFDAWVDRFYSLAQIEADIALGRPVITSQRWSTGELPGAWLSSTGGHLIVVRGFTKSGDVVVNDPFAPSEQGVRRIYPRDAFGRVWLRSGGVVYRMVPLAD